MQMVILEDLQITPSAQILAPFENVNISLKPQPMRPYILTKLMLHLCP